MASSMQRSESITDALPEIVRQNRFLLRKLFARYAVEGKRILHPQQLIEELAAVIESQDERKKILQGAFGHILECAQEAVVVPPFIGFAIRTKPGIWEYVRVNVENLSTDQLTVAEYLQLKECLVDERWSNDEYALELDFECFNASFPRMRRPSSIGNGIHFFKQASLIASLP